MSIHFIYLLIILVVVCIFYYKYQKATSGYLEDLDMFRKQAESIGKDLQELRVAHTTLIDQRMAQLQRILNLHEKADIVNRRVQENGYATTADVEDLVRIIEAIKGIKLELL